MSSPICDHFLTNSIFYIEFLLLTSLVMSAPNTGTNANKRPVEEPASEVAVLRAFVENGFPVWAQRVPGDYLARRVAGLTIKCQ